MEHGTIPFLDIGIDGFGFYAPRDRVCLEDLAQARGVDPAKYTDGLLLKEFAVPDHGEDAVTMAVMASLYAIWKSGTDPQSIDCILVGTETSAYAVKCIATILAGILGISENTITGDLSHACASATCSVLNAIGLISAGLIKRALVVGTDISKYPLGSAGEPTQGAGAVALIISRNPRIAKFSANIGKVSGHINDFFRPNGQDTAIVYGHYSVDAYLAFQKQAMDDLTAQIGSFYPDYWIFHSPYAKLPVQFFRHFIVRRAMENPGMFPQNPMGEVNPIPNRDANKILSGKAEISPGDLKVLRCCGWTDPEICDLNDFIQVEIKARLYPSLAVSQSFGNMYSASVWSQVLWMLEQKAQEGDLLYFGSYGSGATAIAGLLEVQPGFRSLVNTAPRVLDFMNEKECISVEQYETRHRAGKTLPVDLKFGQIDTGYGALKSPQGAQMGLWLSFCDAGCVLPHNRSLAYCPHGHFGRFNRFFPLVGQVSQVKESEFADPLCQIANGCEVPILGNVEPGDFVQLNFRRLREDEDKLMQWAPVYEVIYSINVLQPPDEVGELPVKSISEALNRARQH